MLRNYTLVTDDVNLAEKRVGEGAGGGGLKGTKAEREGGGGRRKRNSFGNQEVLQSVFLEMFECID